MKIQSLMCAVFLIFISLFSEKIFAQGPPDPGGDPMDSIVIKKPMVQVIPLQSPPRILIETIMRLLEFMEMICNRN